MTNWQNIRQQQNKTNIGIEQLQRWKPDKKKNQTMGEWKNDNGGYIGGYIIYI